MLVQQETSKKYPEFKYAPPFILLENDIIVYLHWNAPQQCGGKQSGDVDWLIIIKPRLLSTQQVQPWLQCICNEMYWITILISGANASGEHMTLFSVSSRVFPKIDDSVRMCQNYIC